MAFKISTEVLATKITAASESYSEITKALESAQQALDAATAAVGGNTTDIGRALVNVMGTYTESQYTASKDIIDNMALSVSKVKEQYEEANNQMVSFINALNSSASADTQNTQ